MLTLLYSARPEHTKFLPRLANYLLRQWNQTHGDSEQVDLVDHIAVVTLLDVHGEPTESEIIRFIQVDRYAQGAYVEGQPDGPWEFRHRNGKKSAAGEFRQGVKVGEWTTWYPNGNLESRGRYQNDLLDGPWEFYDEEGQCVRELYRAGQMVSDLPAAGPQAETSKRNPAPQLND